LLLTNTFVYFKYISFTWWSRLQNYYSIAKHETVTNARLHTKL
jgi:hypothetical protein